MEWPKSARKGIDAMSRRIKKTTMKTELQENLLNKYPEFFEYIKPRKIYRGGKATMHQEVQELLNQKDIVLPIQFGFECGDGWYFILEQLMSNIQWHLKNINDNIDEAPRYKLLDEIRYKLQVRTSVKQKTLRKIGEWLWKVQPRGGKPHIEVHVTQIKEKWGGLCFYHVGGDEAIHGMVSLAESMSYKTCETCGTTNNVGRTQGWVYTCCKACYDKNERAQNLEWRLYGQKFTKEMP